MKPRNNFEKRAAELNAALTEDIAASNYDWAKQQSYQCNMGSANYIYFTICSNISEFEVNRLYRLYRFDDKSTSHFFCIEIMREFTDGEKKAYFSKTRFAMGAASYDCFAFGSGIELKDNRKNYAGNMLSWLMDYSIGSHSDVQGKRVKCERRDPKELARVICNNPVAETMYKQNNPMFSHLLYRTYLKETCRAYTIAKRHGFTFNSCTIPLWLDMVYAIIISKKDWHNPVYIAPQDLMATHDRFIRMMIRKQQEIKLAREYKKIQRELERNKAINEKYIERRKRFFDMVLTDGLIECRVLRDVKEFAEEGMAMEHCVYKCRYFEKPYSLILSARINGERIETIEVDLTDYKVKQCYGKHDQFTPYHQQIVHFIQSNMHIIKAYNENKTTNQKAA